jgi:septal ring factor EnvC (AmiA/AmiB activator)
LKQVVADRESALTGLRAELGSRVKEIERLQTARAEDERLLAAREAELKKLQVNLAARETEIERLRKDLGHLRNVDIRPESKPK